MRISSYIMQNTVGLEGNEFTDVVRKCYEVIKTTGQEATYPSDWELFLAADDDLALFPNLEVTPVGEAALREAFPS